MQSAIHTHTLTKSIISISSWHIKLLISLQLHQFLDHIYKAQEIIKLSRRRKTPLHFVLKSTTTHTYQDDLYIKQ